MKEHPGTRVIQCTLNRKKPVKAAVVVFGDKLEVIHDPQLVTENVAAVLIKAGSLKLGALSVYFEGDLDLDPYLIKTKEFCAKICSNNLIIGGDVNAKSHWWGSKMEDHRGAQYNTFLNEMDFQILNNGNVPTFEIVRGDKLCTSVVDVTVCSLSLLDKIVDWKVDRGVTTSDHNAITFTLCLEKSLESLKLVTTRIYNTKKAKWSDFRTLFKTALIEKYISLERVSGINNQEELEDLLDIFTKAIHEICEITIPKIGSWNGKPKPPWWSTTLEDLRKDVLRKKRRIRNAAPSRRQFTIDDYTAAKITYQLEALQAATQNWKEFCRTQDRESMWDSIYRIIRRTNKRSHDVLLRNSSGGTLSPEQSAELLAKTFYQDDLTESDQDYHTTVRKLTDEKSVTDIKELSNDDPAFTTAELDMVLTELNPKKAPGPDGLSADICIAAIHCNKEVFLAIANKCLSLSYFPKAWKVAHVCIIRKPGKDDYTHPKSYRPIGLLSVLGKIVEKLLIRRLQWHFLPTLNDKQYGFIPQRGTEDALYNLIKHIKNEVASKKIVLLVSLDIEGAFDNAWWPALKKQLINKKCPKNLYSLVCSYLQDRKVQVNYARATSEKHTTKGCVQGSIGGPTFWNLILDSLLQELDGYRVYSQAFADDVVLVFSHQVVSTLQQTAETTLASVQRWGAKNKLNFAAHKTNAMVITKKHKYDVPIVHMSGTRLNLVKEIKLLGLIIDHKLTFNPHVSATCRKAADIYKQLARAAKVTWGLNTEVIKTIYVSVIEPIVLYAASAWSPAAEKIMIKNQLDSLQRGFAQKICKAYRTVSLTSALILSSTLPLDLRVQEASALFKIKKGYSEDFLPLGREVENRVGLSQNPHPAQLTATDYELLEDMSLETLEHKQIIGPQIYTDGSKIEGKVGAALTLWNEGKETKYSTFRLEYHNTVFQSEMYALFRAVQLATKSKYRSINIMSDSRSSLDLLQRPLVTHQMALDIKENISKIQKDGRSIRFFWLRAHVGTPGNERADELAKKAALTKRTAPDYDKVPVSFVKKQIREDTVRKWQQRYESAVTGMVTKAFFPTVSLARRILKDFTLTPIHVQIFTGHGGLAAYLHRFNLRDSPSCICDPASDETIWHLLFECPRFGSDRNDLETAMQIELNVQSLPTIMENQAKRSRFLAFASKVVLAAGKRNGSYMSNGTSTVVPTPTLANSFTIANLSSDTLSPPLDLILGSAENGQPGLKLRSVALFMDGNSERLGISFCKIGNSGNVEISPGLAALMNGSTFRTTMSRSKYNALPESLWLEEPCRLAKLNNKTILLLAWGEQTPFARASLMLTRLKEGQSSNVISKKISIDAMVVGSEKGEVADRQGCLKASIYHEVVVYEDRAEDLSFLKERKTSRINSNDDPKTANMQKPQTGSKRLQEREALHRDELNTRKTGSLKEKAAKKGRLEVLTDALTRTLALRPALDKQGIAAQRFLKQPVAKQIQLPVNRTRADKGQVNPPNLKPVYEPLDHFINAFLEFQALITATREVNSLVCKNILLAYQRDNKNLLNVRLEEAEAAIYNNQTSQVIAGTMTGLYMTAYSATCGFVALNEENSARSDLPKYMTPLNDPIVVIARCTRIMLDDRILQKMDTISGNSKTSWQTWEIPEIKWINGVPGSGKTESIIGEFKESGHVIITTTIEAANDLRSKLTHRIGNMSKTKVRTMASILANGFSERDTCERLTFDEALMNHFGAIVMAARLSGANKIVLIGDINQIPYFDRENLFEIRYSHPNMVTNIDHELVCTHRNPMDVVYALNEVYAGMYSSTSKIRSMKLASYTDTAVPTNLSDTLYLVHTQDEKSLLHKKGYGTGFGSRLLTIHEAQGLTYTSVIVLQTKTNKLRIHDSVPHAVVAISRHTKSCVYYTVSRDDAIARFIGRATAITDKKISDHNLKMAMQNRDWTIIENMLKLTNGNS